MSPDDIDTLTLRLYDFLTNVMRVDLNEDSDYNAVSDFLAEQLEPFITRDRNYN
jgi:hypothetical protein